MVKRDSYHHGDLRRALLEAALQLVTERGPKGFTFAEVAKRTGVSVAAPYRHFTDKADLLAAVARLGFDQLHRALTEPIPVGEPVAVAGELSRRYVNWATANADIYQVMFGNDLDRHRHPELIEAADRAFNVVLTTAQSLPAAPPPLDDPRTLAAALWALSHGAATLHMGGELANTRITTPPEAIAAATTTALVRQRAELGHNPSTA